LTFFFLAHSSLTFSAVFENDPLKHPIFEHLNDHRTLLWQRSLILNLNIITKWGMNTVLQAFFGLSGEDNSFYAQKCKRTVSMWLNK
jgi:hypothetical protein